MIKDRLTYYNKLVGPQGDRLATFYRFQGKPNSDFPKIYLPYDSLLNHKSRLAREAKAWLGDILSADSLEELQLILICHDVGELIHGDPSRLSASQVEVDETYGIEDLLLPEDVVRLSDFVTAQTFLEKGGENLPRSPLSIIARVMDTIDGDIFAYALLENYAFKVGGETTDPVLQQLLDRSYTYVNKMRDKYRKRVATVAFAFDIDLASILQRLHRTEIELLGKFERTLTAEGYKVSEII